MIGECGLRERKKLAVRAAMSAAALRTALTAGLRAVSAETVARAVGVSPRTFRNYFGSVEEAVVADVVRRGHAVVAALTDRPAGESVWDSLLAVLPAHVDEFVGDRDTAVALFRLFDESPALVAHQLAAFASVEELLAIALAERTGTDRAADPTPTLLAGSAIVAVRVAVERWVHGHGENLPDLTRDCLDRLRAGLPGAPPTAG